MVELNSVMLDGEVSSKAYIKETVAGQREAFIQLGHARGERTIYITIHGIHGMADVMAKIAQKTKVRVIGWINQNGSGNDYRVEVEDISIRQPRREIKGGQG